MRAAKEAKRSAEDRRDEADRQLEGWAAVDAARVNAEGSLSIVRTRLDLIDEVRALAGTILGYEQRIEDIARDVAAFSGQSCPPARPSRAEGTRARTQQWRATI